MGPDARRGPPRVLNRTDTASPVGRTAFSARVWRPAVNAAGLPQTVAVHALRHFHASLLIRHGEDQLGSLAHISAGQAGATDESACTPGSVPGRLAASR